MELFLTDDEQQQLESIADRYEYAQLLWNITIPTECANKFTVDPVDAWDWKEAVDREQGWLPLAQGTLKQKLIKLYEAIS